MQEKECQNYEDCSLYAGDLEEETNALLKEPDTMGITYSTGVLTLICC